jgi:hypothetical protein
MKVEYGDFYKFMSSVGIVLIGLTFLVPWLFLREPFGLLTKQQDLFLLTPIAQTILQERQELISNLIHIIPWYSLIVFGSGVIILVCGAYKWWSKTQKMQDELSQLEKRKKQLELIALTPEEVKEKRLEDAKAELVDETRADLVEDTKVVKDFFDSAVGIEEKIVELFKLCLPDHYEVLTNQLLGSHVLFDIVLRKKSPSYMDFIVDVKYIRRGFKYDWLRESVLRIYYSSLFYQRETNRDATSVLLIVAPEDTLSNIRTLDYKKRLNQEIIRLGGRAFVIFYTEQQVYSFNCENVKKLFDAMSIDQNDLINE